MKRNQLVTGALAVAGLLGLVAGVVELGRARADGVPTINPLSYAGTLEDGGKLVDGVRKIQLALWDSESGTGSPLCLMAGADVTVTNGRFRLPLSADCLGMLAARPDVYVEPAVVEGNTVTTLPRRKIGAVPYAVEAARASAAGGGLRTELNMIETRLAPAPRTALSYYKTGNQMAANGKWTIVQFDMKQYDDGNELLRGQTFHVNEGGTYQVTCSIMYRDAANPTDPGVYVAAVVTTPTETGAETTQLVSASINALADQTTVVANRTLRLAAGTELTCMAYQASNGDKTIYAGPEDWARAPRNFFSVTRLF